MSSAYQNENNQESTVSVIHNNLTITGDLSFTGDLHIYGEVNGNIVAPIDSDSTLTLHEGSIVHGEIRSPFVIISSRVTGDIFACKRITLTQHSNVEGNVHYCELSMEKGASINGILAALETPPI